MSNVLKCQLSTDHPLNNILAPMLPMIADMSVKARTPETIAMKQQRKREILKSQGLLGIQQDITLSKSL